MNTLRPSTRSRAAAPVLMWPIAWGLFVMLLLVGLAGRAAEDELSPAKARADLLAGRYAEAVNQAGQALRGRADSEEWRLILLEGLLATGRYPEARAAATEALAKESRSLRLRWVAREVFFMNDQPAKAAEMVKDITEFVAARPWGYREAQDLVVFGRAAVLAGADPKRVLDRIYETAKKTEAGQREAWLAVGELALEKHDYALAAKTFQEGLKKLPNDPDLQYGLARAYAPSEAALTEAALEAALRANTNHTPSLLLLADHAIDAEDHTRAQGLLDRVLAVNPWHPEAWAYRAVLARLQNKPAREQAARESATKFWPTNPRVPHLIGRKLSQDYRFAEGAPLQREALRYDPDYLPAKAQLAHDLLRLGEDDEGWRLAEEVHQKDGYDVAALNLVTLRDTMAKYTTLTNRHFIVRMTAKEASLYGPRVLDLLEAARARLAPKYGFELERPVRVEIFAEQKDFAVRTFGMPENHGFLGVCFGPVITANSPASRPDHPFNWEAMLWHEFCHVITLQLTRNKMPRWLSEGISVYEERQANPAWGERMVPKYREMILGDDLTPVGELSGAFLSPRSAVHLQFAYYQCSLVVEFLVGRFGFDRLTAILRDLGEGLSINAAIAKHTAPMPEIEKEFAAFARRQAEQFAPGLDWSRPAGEKFLPDGGAVAWAAWAKARPTNFYVLTQEAARLTEEKQWAEAKVVLQRLVEACPEVQGFGDVYALLAAAHRELGETNAERQVLARLVGKDDKSIKAYQRSMELAAAAADWPGVIADAQRYLAVNPLVPAPYRYLAQAAEQTADAKAAIRAYQALLALDPPNPAEIHFLLARQLHKVGDPSARRHVLQALEEAPRYRAALRLLLELGPTDAAGQTAASQARHAP